MKIKTFIAAASLAAMPFGAHAAVTVSQHGSTSLGAFSFAQAGNVITIDEDWTNSNNVFLRFEGLDAGVNYTVIKRIRNLTAATWTSLANELLDPAGQANDASDPAQPGFIPAGFTTSNDFDGLSFAQGSGVARTSSLFPTVVADELSNARDFLDFFGASAGPGSSFSVQFGLRDNSANNQPFLLSQRVNVRSVVPGVPEPTTWAMLISGFGVIGVAMRRRRRVNVSFV